MTGITPVPTREDLIVDLKRLRDAGFARLVDLEVPALRLALQAFSSNDREAVALRRLLEQAQVHLGSGPAHAAAGELWELAPDTSGISGARRRRRAAEAFNPGVVFDTFRRDAESYLIGQMAEGVLQVLAESTAAETNPGNHVAADARSRTEPEQDRSDVALLHALLRLQRPLLGLHDNLSQAHPWFHMFGELDYFRGEDGRFEGDAEDALIASDLADDALSDWVYWLVERENASRVFGDPWISLDRTVAAEIAAHERAIFDFSPKIDRANQSWIRSVWRNDPDAEAFLTTLRALTRGASVIGQFKDPDKCFCFKYWTQGTLTDRPVCYVLEAIRSCDFLLHRLAEGVDRLR